MCYNPPPDSPWEAAPWAALAGVCFIAAYGLLRVGEFFLGLSFILLTTFCLAQTLEAIHDARS